MLHSIRRTAVVLLCIIIYSGAYCQTVTANLAVAFKALEEDPQMKGGIASLYVLEANTGNVIFEKNSSIGLATASTMKVITSVSAYELLGRDFRYKTDFGYTGNIDGTVLRGDLFIRPSGDPTLGSWRWKSTSDDSLLRRLKNAVKNLAIKRYGTMKVDTRGWEGETIPDGWMWQDIGNYYGAGATGLNWRENQYDILLSTSDKIGSSVNVLGTVPTGLTPVNSMAKAAAKGTGDNAYVYYPLGGGMPIVRGTIPIAEKRFTISAAIPDVENSFLNHFQKALSQELKSEEIKIDYQTGGETVFHTEISPPLDSIIYWFNKRSINLYGEALLKTIGFQKEGKGDTEAGVDVIKNFWKTKGLDVRELSMVDGSGLSPLNRVTTKAQVFVLRYAQGQPWYGGFYHSLPEYNGMKLKSGTIKGVKGYCGYHKSANGVQYIVSILVNNYNGPALSVVQKMYRVLDTLK